MLLVLDNVEPPLVRLVAGLANVVAGLGKTFPNVYITHGRDGGHMKGTLHSRYAALDVRTKNLTKIEIEILIERLRVKFPLPRFDVIHEDPGGLNQHLHLEDNSARPEVTT